LDYPFHCDNELYTLVLIIFGPGKLPDIGNSIGKAIKAMKEPEERENNKPDSQENDKK